MIVYDIGDARFNFRVAGVAYHADRVLLQTAERLDFWFLPGGRVEMLESATDALARELDEELHVQPRIGRLLWLVENFFTLEGRRYHELGLYFAIGLPPSVPTEGEFDASDPCEHLIMRWVPLEQIEQFPVQPAFLRTALANPPATAQHIVHHDRAYNQPVFTGGNLTIMVNDMERSIRFYTEALGLPLKFRAGNEWAEVTAPDVAIGLHPAGGHAPTGAGGGMSLGFQVADIEAAIDALKARGVAFPHGWRDTGELRMANFSDPDGTHLYLFQSKP